jgi:hypothetical protein
MSYSALRSDMLSFVVYRAPHGTQQKNCGLGD